MPNLPEGATSIFQSLDRNLERAAQTRAALREVFDWQPLVETCRPGAATEGQRQQALRLREVQWWITRWAERLGLPLEHVEECALFTVTSTPPDFPTERTNALAAVILWIYVVDDLLDTLDLTGAIASAAGAPEIRDGQLTEAEWLIEQTVQTLLAQIGRQRAPHPQRETFQQERQDRTPVIVMSPHTEGTVLTPAPSPVDESPLLERVGVATNALFTQLERAWDGLHTTRGRARYRRRLIADALRRCVLAMRQEMYWNLTFSTQRLAPSLPSFDKYLRNGADSIGMFAVAATVASFETAPQRVWRRSRSVTALAGRIVRLTNDVHTYSADAQAGKVSAVMLRLLPDLDHLPGGALAEQRTPERSDKEDDWYVVRAVEHAKALVSEELLTTTSSYARTLHHLSSSTLRYYLTLVVAFALAVYGDGGQFQGQN